MMAQQQEEGPDKVQLLSARSAELVEENGLSYRKVVGPARFLHNDTYLLCDTALWNVNTNVIDAMGNVRIIQDQTQLSSSTLQYVVDENMARFRGNLVQLEDKDRNTLRTRYLDYNTKDSVAIFQDGAAMRDKDGQIIESLYGTYDAKAKLFVFNDQVNMYLDTSFVKTSRLEYRTDESTARFGFGTDMWQDDKMLSANDGWYDRTQELFHFRRKVHLLTEHQESWSDSLYYYRSTNDLEMLGNVELMDTTRNAFALAGRIEYTDSLDQIRMTRDPAIMSVMEEKERVDTLYLGADVLLLRSFRRCDIPEPWVNDAKKRQTDIAGDPVMEYRKKAAEAAAKAAEEAAKNDPNRPPDAAGKNKAPGGNPGAEAGPAKPDAKSGQAPAAAEAPAAPPKAPPAPADTTAAPAPADTTAVPSPVDTVKAEPQQDTTQFSFLWGTKHVRLFRRDLQMSCDSLVYSDLDSMVRLYKEPIFYNEGNRQYASDSIYMVIKNRQMEKAHLLSNAFITIQEDPICFDQIRGTEMVAYFDSTTALTRFDALGGASSLFYLEEEEVLATVNKVESKMIYATFKDGTIERIYYYDSPKNDGYPSVQLPEDDKKLKGFRWEPDRRPASPSDVTSLVPRRSQRTAYLAHPHPQFKQTEIYFPGYINKVYRDIAIRDSLQVVREREKAAAAAKDKADTLTAPSDTLTMPADTLAAPLDTLARPDMAAADSTAIADTTQIHTPADTLTTNGETLTREELKAQKKARKEALKAQKQAEREARWAEKDEAYARKQEAKQQKKLEKERKRKLKQLQKLEKRARKEQARFEKYLQKEREKAQKKKPER